MKLPQEYKRCRKAAKRICAQAQAASMDELYNELKKISTTAADRHHVANELQVSSKFAGTTFFKIAAQRRRNVKEIDSPKFINDEDGKLLTRDQDILCRWRRYCDGLLNEEFPRRYAQTEEANDIDVEDSTNTGKNRSVVAPLKPPDPRTYFLQNCLIVT